MALRNVLRGLSVVTVLGFTYALVRLVDAPGAGRSRLLLFGVLLGLAYLGLAGLVFDVPDVTVVCSVALILVALTQFVLFVYILPTGSVLLVAGISSLVPRPTGNAGGPTEEG